jgi:plastocyanin
MSAVSQRTWVRAPAPLARWGLRSAVAAAIVAATFCWPVVNASANVDVSIVFRAYQPAMTTVNLGETVIWNNTTLMPHTVTAVDGAFDSGRMNGGTSFSVTFTKPGSFLYACTIHPSMKGTVLVRDAASAPQTVAVQLSARTAGGRRSIHVQAPRPGASVILERRRGGAWAPLSRAHLSGAGTATLNFAASLHTTLRVVVPAAAGESRLVSRTLHS